METLALLGLGVIIGVLLRNKGRLADLTEKATTVMIWILLFFLGVSVGTNEEVLNNLTDLGGQALLLTLGGIGGSIFCSYFIYKLFYLKK
ncbi:LysO family transporter [Sediminitomix flava]|uniref:Lysine exporter LysO-like protein n=1 Tax=Sediminitomix flava TaxID=379075 RepID=A0A315ZC23_SEDFL|nr:LysO family transporter [Sediminitomix flava]PWJ43126.1 lysine exporter LysO-like protein [Sediminitomix flava]